ncbi:MAG: transporter [Verrucomicrobiaceae bacterium]|nr:transporter [Verrucomicrobiaceae bacterium]
MTAIFIEIKNLHKRFAIQPRDVINDLSLTLPHGESLSLLGPSGCGKTTLLRLIMGLEQPSAGSIEIEPTIAPHMSYVFQEPRLVPWRTTLENVLLPLELLKRDSAERCQHARELLQRLGLGAHSDRFPAELSGGMQMRAALARALITDPKLILLDEPFAALDERTRFRLQDLLHELKTTYALQYIFVTHSIAEAIYLGDRVLLLDQYGRQKLLTPVEIGPRSQDTKLSGPFNAMVKMLTQQFADIEQAA